MSEELEHLQARRDELEAKQRRYEQIAEECAAERLGLEVQVQVMMPSVADGDDGAIEEIMELRRRVARLEVKEEAASLASEPSAELLQVRSDLALIEQQREREEHDAYMRLRKPEAAAIAAAHGVIGPETDNVRPWSMPDGDRAALVASLRERAFLFAKGDVHKLSEEEGTPVLPDEVLCALVENELRRAGLVEREAQVEGG